MRKMQYFSIEYLFYACLKPWLKTFLPVYVDKVSLKIQIHTIQAGVDFPKQSAIFQLHPQLAMNPRAEKRGIFNFPAINQTPLISISTPYAIDLLPKYLIMSLSVRNK
jgi:hypothetical protein